MINRTVSTPTWLNPSIVAAMERMVSQQRYKPDNQPVENKPNGLDNYCKCATCENKIDKIC